jgi:hypothetical protein
MHVCKRSRMFVVVLFSVFLLCRGMAADLKYKIMHIEKYDAPNSSTPYQRYIISVDQYHTEKEFRKIICDATKDAEKGRRQRDTFVDIYYRLDAWNFIDGIDVDGVVLSDDYPKKVLVANYIGRMMDSGSIWGLLSVYKDKNGNRLVNNYLQTSFDHTCDCAKSVK